MAEANNGNMFSNMMSFARSIANKAPQQTQTNNPQDAAFNTASGLNRGQNLNNENQNQNQEQKDPFETYAGIFEPADPTKEAKAPSFSLSDEVIGKAAGSIDFLAGLPDDIKGRLDSGEPIDSKTLAALIGHAGRNAYTSAIKHATTLTDKFVGLRSDFDKQGLNKDVQRVLANNNLTKIPGAQNPVVRGFLEMTSSALTAKYPNQSPEWVADKTKQLFLDMAKAMQTSEQDTSSQSDTRDLAQREGFDWDTYLNEKAA